MVGKDMADRDGAAGRGAGSTRYQVGISVSREEHAALTSLAQRAGLTISGYCRRVLDRHIRGADPTPDGALPRVVQAAAETAAEGTGLSPQQWTSAVILAAAGQSKLIAQVSLALAAAEAAAEGPGKRGG